MRYQDFNLTIKVVGGAHLLVSTVRGNFPVIETSPLPFSGSELELLKTIIERDAQGTANRPDGNPSLAFFRRGETVNESAKLLRECGEKLFHTIFAGQILQAFRERLREAQSKSEGIRVRVRAPADLAGYPFEAMYCKEEIRAHLSLFGSLSVVRSLGPPKEVPAPIKPPLTILAVVATPKDRQRIKANDELKILREALALPGVRYEEVSPPVTLERVISAGIQLQPHVLHFIGHGEFDGDEGRLVLENDDGIAHLIPGEELRPRLAHIPSLRLVTLNACLGGVGNRTDLYSAVAISVFSLGIPAVVAMQYQVTNEAATEFTRHFYVQLVLGRPVDEAMTATRFRMRERSSRSPEWITPVLYLGTETGELFQLNLPADEIIEFAENELRKGRHNSAEHIAAILEQHHPGEAAPIASAKAIRRQAQRLRAVVDPVLRFIAELRATGLASQEALKDMLEAAQSCAELSAERLTGGAIDRLWDAVDAIEHFRNQRYAESIEVLDRYARDPYRVVEGASEGATLDLTLFRGRARKESDALREMRRITADWNSGDWEQACRAVETASLRGTFQEELVEHKRTIGRELARALEAINSIHFKKAVAALERIPVDDAPPNLEAVRGLAVIGSRAVDAAEKHDMGALEILKQEAREHFEDFAETWRAMAASIKPANGARPVVFISYAREDAPLAEELREQLRREGYQPWMDIHNLSGGTNWRLAIASAIRSCDFFIACISSRSANKQVVAEEVQFGLNIWREKFEPAAFFLPVRLEDCRIPEEPEGLGRLQWVDLFVPDGFVRLVQAIEYGLQLRTSGKVGAPAAPVPDLPPIYGRESVISFIEGALTDIGYEEALKLMDAGQFTSALLVFNRLGAYKDAPGRTRICREVLDALEFLRAREWDKARRKLDPAEIKASGQRAKDWLRWCLVARKVVPALEMMAAGPLAAEYGWMQAGGESAYKVFAKSGITPSSTIQQCLNAGMALQSAGTGMSPNVRMAWDALRIPQNRLLVDFGLYKVKQPARARTMLERICTIEEGREPWLAARDLANGLGDDAAVFLALQADYDAAMERFSNEIRTDPSNYVALHHLGLAAAARVLNAKGSLSDDLSNTYSVLVASLAAVLADDRFWHEWWVDRYQTYGKPIFQDQINDVRLQVQSFWSNHLKSTLEAQSGLEVLFEAELRGAQAAQKRSCISAKNGSAHVVMGLMGARLFRLTDLVGSCLAKFSPNECQREGPERDLILYFSELAEPAILIEEGRVIEAISVLTRMEANPPAPELLPETSPALLATQGAPALLASMRRMLLCKAHVKACEKALNSSPVAVRNAIEHGRATLSLVEEAEIRASLLDELRGAVSRGAQQFSNTEGEEERLEALNNAVELLDTALYEGWDDESDVLRELLVNALLDRAMHLSKDSEESRAREDASRALSLSPQSLRAAIVLAATSLYYSGQLFMQGQTSRSDALLREVAEHLTEAEQLFPGNPDLNKMHEMLANAQKFVRGEGSVYLSELLASLRGESEKSSDPEKTSEPETEDDRLTAAAVAVARRDFAQAVSLLREAGDLNPGNREIEGKLELCYREWIESLDESQASREEIARVCDEALARCPNSYLVKEMAEYVRPNDNAEATKS